MYQALAERFQIPPITALAWSADGAKLALWTERRTSCRAFLGCEPTEAHPRFPGYPYGHNAPIRVMQWDAGSDLLSASSDGQLRWWDLALDSDTRELLE